MTTVAAIALGLATYDPVAIHGTRIPAAGARGRRPMLLAATREERAAIGVMHPGRVDVIGAGALVLDRIVTRLGDSTWSSPSTTSSTASRPRSPESDGPLRAASPHAIART